MTRQRRQRRGRGHLKSSRRARLQVQEAFDGMPDILANKPPKAKAELVPMTLDEAIARTFELMDEVIKAWSTGHATFTFLRGRTKRFAEALADAPSRGGVTSRYLARKLGIDRVWLNQVLSDLAATGVVTQLRPDWYTPADGVDIAQAVVAAGIQGSWPHEYRNEIITQNYGPREIAGVYGLYSGGNDSVVLPHLLRRYFDGIIHVNTGTAIRQTTEHVREVVPAAWGLPLHELHPPKDRYRDLVLGNILASTGPNKGKRAIWVGFPGPARSGEGKRRGHDAHSVMYGQLKQKPLEAFRTQMVGSDGVRKKVLYVAGTRWDESDQRFELAGQVTQQGGIVWVAALIHWTNEHMQEYRRRYRCRQDHEHAPHRMCFPDALPLNEVTEHIHMSGDCTCGAKAHEGELDEIGFFFPEKAAELRGLQAEVAAKGIPACRWGQRPPAGAELEGDLCAVPATPFLCSGCKPAQEIPGQISWDWDGLSGDSAGAGAA